MSGVTDYTEEERKKAFTECANFIINKHQEAEEAKKKFDDTFKNWKERREETITKVGRTAQQIKKLNDDVIPLQTVCKGLSIVGKIAIFTGPVAAVVGSATAIAADIGYSTCSAVKGKDLEIMCKDAQRTLEKDSEDTQELLSLINEVRTISEDVKKCVEVLHSATVHGFFDVPDLLPFATAVKNIKNIDEPGGFSKFLTVLWEEVKSLWNGNSMFRIAFSTLRTLNPGVTELIVTVPEIVMSCTIFSSAVGSAKAGVALPMGKVLAGLNIFAIIVDFEDIVSKVSSFNEYPKLSKELLVIKEKLQEERDKICKLKEKFRKAASP